MMLSPAAAARATSSAGASNPSDAVVCRWRSITAARSSGWAAPDAGQRSGGRLGTTGLAPFCGWALALPFEQRAILADQQLEVFALFGGELEEDLFAFRVFEAIAVALEEAVRRALAADA